MAEPAPEPAAITEARLEAEPEPEAKPSRLPGTGPDSVADTGLPLPKRKPAFLAELVTSLPEAEPKPAPASEDAALKDLVSKVLDGLKAPQKTAPESEPEPQPTQTGTSGFVGKILDKLKN